MKEHVFVGIYDITCSYIAYIVSNSIVKDKLSQKDTSEFICHSI